MATKSKKTSRKPLSAASKRLIAKGRAYYVPCYKQREMILDRGKGARLFDLDGNDYIDFGAGIAVASLGYGDPDMVKTISAQAKKLLHTSNIFFSEPPIHLAEELVKASGFARRIFFSNSGGEANEAAIKLARKYAADQGKPPEKRQIITFTGSFHGRTLATVTATSQPKYQKGFEPLPGGFAYCPYNDADALTKMMGDHVCAVMIEGLQGEGGIMPAAPGFLKMVQDLCRKHNALLIMDEVQCGMGRTGQLFSFTNEKITPDVVTLAKGLGGGIVIGAMLVGERAAETFQFGNHGSTFGGNPLATGVARVVLKKLQSKALMKNVEARGKQLRDGLEKLNKEFKCFKEVRGRGLMIGAELTQTYSGKAGDFSDACRRVGVIVLQAGPDVLRFVPPLVITKEEVALGLARMREGIASTINTR